MRQNFTAFKFSFSYQISIYYSGEKLEMNACMAYGQVTAPHEVPPSANSEGVYDNV